MPYYQRRERTALGHARLVLCNSRRTAQDVHERLGDRAARTRVVYYGIDTSQFALVSAEDVRAAQTHARMAADRPVVLFVGALGDRRKGFDRCSRRGGCSAATRRGTRTCRGRPRVGAGDLAAPRGRARACQPDPLPGFRSDISRVIARVRRDGPSREIRGLRTRCARSHLPRYPRDCQRQGGDRRALSADRSAIPDRRCRGRTRIADRLQHWRSNVPSAAARIRPLSDRLRARTWRDMGAEIERAVTA